MGPRVLAGEWMDAPDAPRDELDRSLGFIRAVNRVLGGRRALVGQLAAWSRAWPRDRSVTLLDVGTGSADLPVEAVRWAKRAGRELRVTGVDVHETTASLARAFVDKQEDVRGSVEVLQADALQLVERFGPASFDYVHAGMFLHHLGSVQVLTMLRVMDRIARRGIIVNDLARTRLGVIGAKIITLGQGPMVRHDAVASVRAGFTKAEVLDMARRVDVGYCTYRFMPMGQRFVLAGEKPGAWERT